MRENLLIGGDYVPDGVGGSVRKDGAEGLLCEALFRLSCRRGSFPFLPELGSRLYLLQKQKRADRELFAQQYCAEALTPLGLTVRQVRVTEQGDRQLLVEVSASAGEDAYTLEVNV